MQSERERTQNAVLVEPVDRAALRAQIDEWNQTPIEGVGALAVLEVKVMNGAVRSPVARHPFTRGETSVDKLKERIADQIENDAYQVRGFRHQYVIHAYFGEQSLPAAHIKASCRWDEVEPDYTVHGGTGSAARDGIIMQKHARDAIHGMVESGKDSRSERRAIFSAWSEERSWYVARNRELEEQLKAQQAELEEARDRKQERVLKAEQSRALLEWGKELVDALKNHIPIIVNYLAKEQVMPVPDWAHPVVVILQRLYERITRNQGTLDAVLEALFKDEQAFKLFGELMNIVEDQKQLALVRARVAAETAGAAETARINELAKVEADTAKKPNGTNGHRAATAFGFRGYYG